MRDRAAARQRACSPSASSSRSTASATSPPWSYRSLDAWTGVLLAVPAADDPGRDPGALARQRAPSPARGAVRRRRRGAGRAHPGVARGAAPAQRRAPSSRRGRADLRARRAARPRRSAPGCAPATATWWLVAPAIDRARASVEADQKALEALATVAEEAFSRLALTDEMGHLARHDALTALPNRTLFLDRVAAGRAALPAQRRGHRRALPRPRRLQGRQRPLRPRRGRRAAQGGRRPAGRLRARGRLGRPARRRRVRRARRGRRRRRRARRPVPAAAGLAARARS